MFPVLLISAALFACASPAQAVEWQNQDSWTIKPGGSFDCVHTLSHMDLRSKADLLGGTNTGLSDKVIVTAWAPRNAKDLWLGNEMLSLSGLGGDKTVLQFKYDDTPFANVEKDWAKIGLITVYRAINGEGGGPANWINASYEMWLNGVSQVSPGDKLWNYQGSWKQAGSPMLLGAHGVDIKSNTVWTVLNTDGVYAPEPTTMALLALGGVMLLLRRRNSCLVIRNS